MTNKTIIESLSMDLLRVALGYHRGSMHVAKRFSQEAMKRINEVDRTQIKPYFIRLLDKIPRALANEDTNAVAEDALMYSTLSKNYAKHFA